MNGGKFVLVFVFVVIVELVVVDVVGGVDGVLVGIDGVGFV